MGNKEVGEVVVAVNPDLYYDQGKDLDGKKRKLLKKLINDNGLSSGMKKASEFKVLEYKPLSSFKMTYDSDMGQLEPVYFWLLDFMQDAGVKVKKITDNFASAPGSGQFSEMGNKATAMQQQATKILADTNVVIKSILQLVYDLKEFEIRLKQYDRAKSKDAKEREEGMLAIKNIWLDQVDMKRGRGSIHQMSYEMGFTTLREAFLIANTTEDVDKMAAKDGVINDSVKRILIPRLGEFLIWKDSSESELSKRFNIEKSYLKTQVESLKLYTRWAKPYLKAAEDLRMKGFDKDASLVSAFSTTRFELTLLGQGGSTKLPKKFKDYKLKRDYSPVYVVSLQFRGSLAQRVTQKGDYGFGYGGRVDVTFDCYALNSEELKFINKEIENEDAGAGLSLLQDNTGVALDQLKDDLEHFLDDDKKEEKKKTEKKDDYPDPFTALFGGIKDLFSFKIGSTKNKKVVDVKDIEKDNFVEKEIRKICGDGAKDFMYAVYDVYKKAHGMASSPENFDY